MEIIGFILGIFVGFSLGLIGSGGAVITIPTLVYFIEIAPSKAVVYSMFIVGISAFCGAIKGTYDRLVDFKMALYFGIPSIISVFVMRMYINNLLPNIFFTIHCFTVTKDAFIMVLFSVLMLSVSISMIKNKDTSGVSIKKFNKLKFVIKGILVGFTTGFIGVGGGFLIIPTLIFSGKMNMRNAVVTSLWIIAANSLIGFFCSIHTTSIDWNFLIKFTFLGLLGLMIGLYLSKKCSHVNLKPVFGWFVLTTGIYILLKELIF